MEQNLKILAAALDGANKQGVYSLQESATIFQAFQILAIFVNDHTIKENVESEVEPETNK